MLSHGSTRLTRGAWCLGGGGGGGRWVTYKKLTRGKTGKESVASKCSLFLSNILECKIKKIISLFAASPTTKHDVTVFQIITEGHQLSSYAAVTSCRSAMGKDGQCTTLFHNKSPVFIICCVNVIFYESTQRRHRLIITFIKIREAMLLAFAICDLKFWSHTGLCFIFYETCVTVQPSLFLPP